LEIHPRNGTKMRHLSLRRLVVAAVAVGVLGSAGPAFAAQPSAGSVGRADHKTPAGQSENDRNRGYGCDDNNGVGKGNPAHSPCPTDEVDLFSS
jgi:hypothetical protein